MSQEPGGFEFTFDEEPQPGYPQGYPPQGYPQPGYPPQGYAPQPYPQQGYAGPEVDQTARTLAEGAGGGRTMRDEPARATIADGAGSAPRRIDQGSSTMADGAHGHGSEGHDLEALVGRKVDRYYIKKLLGEGGFGAVYLAEHTLMKRDVAFKTLHKELSQDPAILYRFKREGQCSGRFKHKNAIELYDFGQMDDGTFFMAMELMRGEDLRDYIKRKGALEIGETFDIMIQSLAAVQAMHDGGVIHRDLKPDNIKLEKDEGIDHFVKVFDFGIAKLQDDDPAQAPSSTDRGYLDMEYGQTGQQYKTQVGAFFGTPEYGSPEQCAGEEIDNRSDLYTMGVILYECLSGQLPFSSKTPQGYLAQHMVADPRPIAEINPDLKIPADIEAIVQKSMSKEREERFQTAREFAEALEEAAQKLGIQLQVDTSIVTVIKTPVWKLALMVLVPVLAIGLGAGYYVWKFGGGDPVFAGLQTTIASLSTNFDFESALKELQGDKYAEQRIKEPGYFFGFAADGTPITDPGAIDSAEKPGKILEVKRLIEARKQKTHAFAESIRKALQAPEGQRNFEQIMARITTEFRQDPELSFGSAAKELAEVLEQEVIDAREREAESARSKLAAIERPLAEGLEYLEAKKVYDTWDGKKYGATARFPQATTAHDLVVKRQTDLQVLFDSADKDDKVASEKLKGIRDYYRGHPEDWPGVIKQLKDFQEAYKDNRFAIEAKSFENQIDADWSKVAQAALAETRAGVATAIGKESLDGLGEAFDAIDGFSSLHRQRPEIKGELDRLRLDIAKTASERQAAAQQQAQALYRKGQIAAGLEALRPWLSFSKGGVSIDSTRALVAQLETVLPLHAPAKMVKIPAANKYVVGDTMYHQGQPPQTEADRSLPSFHLDKNEVTNEEYLLFLRSTDRLASAPATWAEGYTPTPEAPFPPDRGAHPVRGVSWDDANAYAQWAGKRLPTEFEWEYAGRGPSPWTLNPDGTIKGQRGHILWSWGADLPNTSDAPKMARLKQEAGEAPTSAVGSFEKDVSIPFGVVDLVGNVREWTNSPFEPYQSPASPRVVSSFSFNPTHKVIRGGSWKANGQAMAARLTLRMGEPPTAVIDDVGFRCAKDAED